MSSHSTPPLSDDPNDPYAKGTSHPKEQQLELGEDDSAIALRKAWERTLRALANKYNKPTFENFLKPLKPLSFDGEIVVLGAPSAFARVWAESKYNQVLRDLLQQNLGLESVQIRFVISSPDVQPLLGEKPLPLQQAASPLAEPTPSTSSTLPATLESLDFSSGTSQRGPGNNPFMLEMEAVPLNEKYTFDQFVIGKSNQLAHAGALAVANAPGAAYNPLFLYGSPGLGKTHLMHAIGHHVRRVLPQARVAYVSGETFTNHFVAALRERRTEDFRRAYRHVDVWLVDDIQTIASGQKEQTKEEFFHTFNTLQQMNRQIVIASDRPPRELRAMDERLRSRFIGGLVADIAPPELETRMAILQKKAILENMRIPEEVIAYMANLIQSNIRALEGALTKLMVYASLAKSPVTKQLACDVLSNYFVDQSPRLRELPSANPEYYAEPKVLPPVSNDTEHIIEAVAAELNIDKELIATGGGRRKEVMLARQIAMYLAREMSRETIGTLATAFHCRTHTAISHAHARLSEAIKDEVNLATVIRKIQQRLQG